MIFRGSNRRVPFSFSRLGRNAAPNSAELYSGCDLSLAERDSLFKWQLAQAEPRKLNQRSFFMGGIVAQESQSRALFTSLSKSGILSEHDGSLHTENITKHLLNRLPTISIHATRKLISLLFFWEEEIIYYQVLDLQEDEAREAIAATGGEGRREDLVTLEGVKRRRALAPSQRDVYARGRRESAPPPYEA